MSEQDDNFLSRWSRRKAQVRQGVEPPSPPAPAAARVPAAAAVDRPPAAAADAAPAPAPPVAGTRPDAATPAVTAPPRPTLQDVEALTPESDFSRFIARDVDETVKNSAMKKLFADPHYNVMDGLDIYIGDYNTPDPLPKAMLRQMVQARMLGLLDDELPEQPAADGLAPPDTAPVGELALVDAAAEVEADSAPAHEPGPDAANDAPAAADGEPLTPPAPAAWAGADAALPLTVPAAAPVAAGVGAQAGADSSSKAS